MQGQGFLFTLAAACVQFSLFLCTFTSRWPSLFLSNSRPILSCCLSCCCPFMAAQWTHPLILSGCLLACLALNPPDEPPQLYNLPLSLAFNSSSRGVSVGTPMVLTVFSVDYHLVQAPFEILLWIMLASLAKLGKWLQWYRRPQFGCSRVVQCNYWAFLLKHDSNSTLYCGFN